MKTVLYVDDEPALLDIGRLFLEKTSEFKVITASSAKEGLELIQQYHPDAIVSDYQMSGMDGIGFLKEVRKDSLVPFIMFTGRGSEIVAMDATNNGADYYIQKGANPRALFAELTYKLRLALSDRRDEKEEQIAKKTIRTLIDKAYNAIIIHNVEGRILDVNENMLTMFRISREEALKLTIADLTGPQSPVDIRSDILDNVLAGHDQFLVWQGRRPHDGSLFKIEKFLTRINFGNKMYILCNIRDIAESEEKINRQFILESALNHATEPVICCDQKGTVLYLNHPGRQLFLLSSEAPLGNVHELVLELTGDLWSVILEHTRQIDEYMVSLVPGDQNTHQTLTQIRCCRSEFHDAEIILLYPGGQAGR